jgi:hypothetical protein
MKKLIGLIALCSILLLSATVADAQSTTRYSSRNNDEHIAQVVTTSDSTLTYVDSFKLSTNQTGLVEFYVIGYAKDTAYSVRGMISADFNKRRGTLTLGTLTPTIPLVTDAALGSATFTVVAVNNNIYVRVKGKAATSMRWYSISKLKSQQTVL